MAGDRWPCIRPTTLADVPRLPAVERSAGEAFRSVPALAWVADHGLVPLAEHASQAVAGLSWVAVDDQDAPLGFLVARLAGDELHLHELAVRHDRQRQGIGRMLVETVIAAARQRGLHGVTLTTFRDLPWNERFYRKLGFRTMAPCALDPRLAAALQAEADGGLPRERRCAMRLVLDDRGGGAGQSRSAKRSLVSRT